MKVSKIYLEKVASLAKIEIEGKESIQGDLVRLLEHFEELSRVDLSFFEPMSLPPQCRLKFRLDEPQKGIEQTEALKEAPKTNGKFYTVPKIIG